MNRYPRGMALPPPDFRNQPLPDDVDPNDLPEITEDQFPNTVTTENERLRFRLAYSLAPGIYPDEPIMAWATTNSLYNNPNLPTA